MAGERSERMVEIAARGAARMARRLAVVSDRYAPEGPVADARELRFEDAARELAEVGHVFSRTCTRPFCLQAAAMIDAGLRGTGGAA